MVRIRSAWIVRFFFRDWEAMSGVSPRQLFNQRGPDSQPVQADRR
jgi:hypothetical protein